MREERIEGFFERLLRLASEAAVKDPTLFPGYVEQIELHLCALARAYPIVQAVYHSVLKKVMHENGLDPSRLPDSCRVYHTLVQMVTEGMRKEGRVLTRFDVSDAKMKAAMICFEALSATIHIVIGRWS